MRSLDAWRADDQYRFASAPAAARIFLPQPDSPVHRLPRFFARLPMAGGFLLRRGWVLWRESTADAALKALPFQGLLLQVFEPHVPHAAGFLPRVAGAVLGVPKFREPALVLGVLIALGGRTIVDAARLNTLGGDVLP